MGQVRKLGEKELMRITGVWGKQFQTIQWHSAQIVIRHSVDIGAYVELIRNIVADCRPDGGTVAYELFDFSVRLNTVLSYSFVELPENIADLFYILYNSDLYETVCRYANTTQINSARDAAEKILQSYLAGGESQ